MSMWPDRRWQRRRQGGLVRPTPRYPTCPPRRRIRWQGLCTVSWARDLAIDGALGASRSCPRPALLEGNPAHQPRNSDLTIGVPHVGPSDRERGWRGLGCPLGTHGRRHHLRSGSDEPDGANGTRAKALYFTSGETGPAVILVHGSLPGSSGRARWRCIAPFLSSRTMARTHRQSHPALIATESKSGLFGTRVILAI
jgi:hypothetical protein